MAKPIDYTSLTDTQLLNAINSPKPADAAIREMFARSGGYLPFADGKIVADIALKFLKHVSDLRSNGKTYSGAEYRGVKLAPLATILAAPKVALTCEPFTGHELESDGTDPQTEMSYPVADNDRMLRLAWIARHLPIVVATINLADLDWQQTVMDMLSSGELKPNVRKLMKDFGNASEDEKKVVARRLKPEFWSGVGQVQSAAQVVEQPKPIDLSSPAAPMPALSPSTGPTLYIKAAFADAAAVAQLKLHLSARVRRGLKIVDDASVPPGAITSVYIGNALRSAKAIAYIVSADLLANLDLETMRAAAPDARHVPIILRPCGWQSAFGGSVPLPRDGRSISQQTDKDAAWYNVVTDLGAVLDR